MTTAMEGDPKRPDLSPADVKSLPDDLVRSYENGDLDFRDNSAGMVHRLLTESNLWNGLHEEFGVEFVKTYFGCIMAAFSHLQELDTTPPMQVLESLRETKKNTRKYLHFCRNNSHIHSILGENSGLFMSLLCKIDGGIAKEIESSRRPRRRFYGLFEEAENFTKRGSKRAPAQFLSRHLYAIHMEMFGRPRQDLAVLLGNIILSNHQLEISRQAYKDYTSDLRSRR
jgi:hypothetical protein